MAKRRCRRGEKGRLAGERHPNARYSDHEIEVMRDMHEQHGFGYRRLAVIFECSRSYVRNVCKFKRR